MVVKVHRNYESTSWFLIHFMLFGSHRGSAVTSWFFIGIVVVENRCNHGPGRRRGFTSWRDVMFVEPRHILGTTT